MFLRGYTMCSVNTEFTEELFTRTLNDGRRSSPQDLAKNTQNNGLFLKRGLTDFQIQITLNKPKENKNICLC